MSGELERRRERAPRREEKAGKALLARLWQTLRHNLGWKVLAVILAIGLWAGLITQDPTLMREKTFTDVPVSITGGETLKRNGFVVVSNLAAPSVRLKVDVPQKEYGNAAAANYNVRMDLSRISAPGIQTIKIQATSSNAYGTVVEIMPDTLQVEVEAYETRYRIPVSVISEGEPPAGYYGANLSVDPSTVTISGPASLVGRVSRALVIYDQSALSATEGPARNSFPFVLQDALGEEVSSSLIEVTSESVRLSSVIVGQMLYKTREIDLSQAALTAGAPATGYRVKSVSVTPSRIVAAGRAEALEQIDNLFLDAPVSITGFTETFTSTIRVQKPSGIESLSSLTATVTVEIEPVIITRSFDNVKINAAGLPAGFGAALSQTKASVTISGPQLWLEKIKASGITLSADLTGLSEGEHTVPLLCTVADSQLMEYDYAANPGAISVTLTKK